MSKRLAIKSLVAIIITLLCSQPHSFAKSPAKKKYDGTRVTVCGIRSKKGTVLMYLFDKKARKGFPYNHRFAILIRSAKASEAKDHCIVFPLNSIIDRLKTTYAAYAFHDKNNNSVLDKTFLGFPSEKYGFSGYYKQSIFNPEYKDFEFVITSKRQNIKINI